MNETLIFYKMCGVLKKSEIEAVFNKTEMNNEWNVSHLFFNILFSMGFSLVETRFLLWYESVPSYLNDFYSHKSYFQDDFFSVLSPLSSLVFLFALSSLFFSFLSFLLFLYSFIFLSFPFLLLLLLLLLLYFLLFPSFSF